MPLSDSPLESTGHDEGVMDHGCTRRDVLRGVGVATVAVGAGLSLTSCAQPGVSLPAADVPVGGGAIIVSANYLVTQPVKGQYKAFTKLCPHAQCPVTSINQGEILCRCHGSKFSIKDGSVIKGPATKGLTPAKVALSGDTLTVTA